MNVKENKQLVQLGKQQAEKGTSWKISFPEKSSRTPSRQAQKSPKSTGHSKKK